MTLDAESDQAPIHGLPDELLEIIFLINTSRPLTIKQGNENHTYDPHSTTLASTQVCRRWRTVALDYPVIWSRIIDYERHPLEWIETLLARSGSSLIDVGGVLEPVKLQDTRGKLVLQSIFQRITALKSVSLYIRWAPWESICRSFLAHPAPNLEFLNLTTSCPFPDCLYLNPLFADKAPRLRRLHLQRCLIDFSSAVLSNLTQLSVSDITAPNLTLTTPNPWKVAPSVAGWLRVLKNIPGLRFLTLNAAISHFTEPEPLPVVDLPHLVLLTISARLHPGMSLIDHLNIPPSCGTRFRFYRNHIRSTNGLNSSMFLSFLSQQLAHWPQDHADRYLQAKILSGNRIHFGNSKRVGHPFDMTESDEIEAHSQYSKDPMLSLILMLDSSEDSFTLFNQLLELYSSTFSTTTTLDLWLDEEFTDTATTDGSFFSFHTFHSFTNVKTLNLLEQSPLYLLPLFQTSSLPEHPLFPALQSLYLIGTHMDDEQGALCSVFVAFLLWRAETRVPLPEIKLLAGTISSQTAEDLSRLGNLRVTLGLLDSRPRDYVNRTSAPDTDEEDSE